MTICTESGKLATDACRADPRGSCAQTVYVYPEDRPTQYCDLHVMARYCEGGQAAANDYCAQVRGNTVTEKGLVKMSDSCGSCTHGGPGLLVVPIHRAQHLYPAHQEYRGRAEQATETTPPETQTTPTEPAGPPETAAERNRRRTMGWISNNWKEYELLDATEASAWRAGPGSFWSGRTPR